MRRRMRRRRRMAFTMIELLVVIVILGVLAAIALPRFADSKRKAYLAAMKSDLRNVVSAAESHFAEDGTYANWNGPTPTNQITLTFVGTLDGWVATASHAAVPGIVCRIERGPAAGAATEPVCQ
ncbi:MAG: prepilin-type N-terminal cleavage/methylation domain-containing protein [Gemmatimonadaceae bacterium]|nr:prepilin-type N-terminal cleavage/methylation domain-containing protein [Gemmatimonadaceae bacterium]